MNDIITIREVSKTLEGFAPICYQENYDNSGLQVGNLDTAVRGVLCTLDVTEAVIEEAESKGCSLVVAHHPVIFGGIKKLTGSNYVERIVELAIKKNIALYAAHTNMDNARNGVNALLAARLGLLQTAVLSPMRNTQLKLQVYIPDASVEAVRNALFAAGAGHLGAYSECSFGQAGYGTFRPEMGSSPAIGTAGGQREVVKEVKLEVLVPMHLKGVVLDALKTAHPYEEVAYDFIKIENENNELGAGLYGQLPHAMKGADFLAHLKSKMDLSCIRHSALPPKPVERVALCGGAGSFLLNDAKSVNADVFITGDYKYHQFFDAEDKLMIADIGHYESEKYTPELFKKILTDKYPNFAVLLSSIITNPIQYYF